MLAIEDAVIVYWKPALAVLYVVLSFYFAFTRPSVSWEDEVAQRVMDGHGDVDEVLLEYCDEHPRHEMCR